MITIARFALAYWLAETFMQEVVRTTGAGPFWTGPGADALGLTGEVKPKDLEQLVAAGKTPAGIERRMIAGAHPGLECIVSLHKSLTLARLNAGDSIAAEIRRELVRIITEEFARLTVPVRTGRAGRERQVGLPVVAIAPQSINKAGEPLDHYHILIASVGYSPSQKKLLSIDQPRLFRDLHLLERRINSRIAELFREKLGTRLEFKGSAVRCADIPQACIDAVSSRKQQIDNHLRSISVPPSPRARQIAAHVTRQLNGTGPVQVQPAKTTRDICARLGFEPAKVYGRERCKQASEVELCRLVTETANTLAKKQGTFSRLEHDAAVHSRAMKERFAASAVDRMMTRVYANWAVFGIHKLPNNLYTTSLGKAAWEHFATTAQRMSRPVLDILLRAGSQGSVLLAALGTKASRVARQIIRQEKTSTSSHDYVHVRDLGRFLQRVTKASRVRAHSEATKAALKPGLGGVRDRLRYAEHVYRTLRHPAKIITKRTVIVVKNTSQQKANELTKLVRIAKKHGATVVLTDRQLPKRDFRYVAKKLWPQSFQAARANGAARIPPAPKREQREHQEHKR